MGLEHAAWMKSGKHSLPYCFCNTVNSDAAGQIYPRLVRVEGFGCHLGRQGKSILVGAKRPDALLKCTPVHQILGAPSKADVVYAVASQDKPLRFGLLFRCPKSAFIQRY